MNGETKSHFDDPPMSGRTEAGKPRLSRRYFRFSLRTFLIVVLLLGAWIGLYVNRAEKQRAAVKAIGGVYYDFECFESGGRKGFPTPWWPSWLQETVGVDYFATVYSLSVDTHDMASPYLDDLKNVKYLSIVDVKNFNAAKLKNFTRLTRLTLYDSPANDISQLIGLPNLQRLECEGTANADLSSIVKFADLSELQIDARYFKDLTPLASMTKLKYMYLSGMDDRAEEYDWLVKSMPNCEVNCWVMPKKRVPQSKPN